MHTLHQRSPHGYHRTFCYLARKSVETCLGVVTKSAYGIVYTVKALHNGLLNTIEALAKRLLNACLTKFEVIEVVENGRVVETCGKVSLCSTSRATMSTATKTAKAVAITAPTEDEENYDPIMLS